MKWESRYVHNEMCATQNCSPLVLCGSHTQCSVEREKGAVKVTMVTIIAVRLLAVIDSVGIHVRRSSSQYSYSTVNVLTLWQLPNTTVDISCVAASVVYIVGALTSFMCHCVSPKEASSHCLLLVWSTRATWRSASMSLVLEMSQR